MHLPHLPRLIQMTLCMVAMGIEIANMKFHRAEINESAACLYLLRVVILYTFWFVFLLP